MTGAGALLLFPMGAVLSALTLRIRTRDALLSPTSLFFALALLFLTSLGPAGLGLSISMMAAVRFSADPDEAPPRVPWVLVAGLAVVLLARPWTPLYWDEFVWLGKARLESIDFGHGVVAALDPSQHLIPAGYPALWPAAVGWLSAGADTLDAHVVGAALMTLACAAVCLEAWRGLATWRARGWLVAVAISTPLVWVHLRSAYVDLPVGLLGAAVVGFLLSGRIAQATVLGVVAAGLKDEGVVHVAAATVAAFMVRGLGRHTIRLALPFAFALSVAIVWRVMLRVAGVEVVDHTLTFPSLSWLGTLSTLVVKHAADVATWGVVWAVMLGVCLFRRGRSDGARALQWSAALAFVALALVVLFGSERVQAFAMNGTLINRLLLQVWPVAALRLVLELADDRDLAV